MIFTRKYTLLIAGLCVLGSAALQAQNIELPDVTTIISGETVSAGLDALPSFSDVLEIPENSGKVAPVLPDVDAPAISEINSDSNTAGEKSIYAEGLIGGGYPTLFTGNFSVFRLNGDSPFKLSFEHDSAIGYGNHSLSDGYSDRTTKLAVEKSFQQNQFSWGVKGSYLALANGLQNNVPGITGFNQDSYTGKGNFEYKFSNGFSAGTDLNVDFYNRYLDISTGSFPIASVLDLSPVVFAGWEGHGIATRFSSQYWYETDVKDTVSDKDSHRALFNLDIQWKNDVVLVYGKAGIVVGNQLNDNKVIPPFTLGVDANLPVYFSARPVSIQAKGGLDSKMNKVSELENKYKFSCLNFIPAETTDWYGKVDISIPVKDFFTGTAAIEYRQTAFDNGYCMPDYSVNSGIYGYKYSDMQQVNSILSLTYHYKIFSITGEWKSFWLDVPALESGHEVSLDLNFQSEDSKWGVDVLTAMKLQSEYQIPEVKVEGFVRLTPAVRAVVSVEDAIKLVQGESRTYAGNYITRGGTAALLLKFFF